MKMLRVSAIRQDERLQPPDASQDKLSSSFSQRQLRNLFRAEPAVRNRQCEDVCQFHPGKHTPPPRSHGKFSEQFLRNSCLHPPSMV